MPNNKPELKRINYPEDMQKIANDHGYKDLYTMLLSEYKKGVEIPEIAKKVGWGRAHTGHVLYALGVKPKQWGGKRWSKVPPETVEEIKSLSEISADKIKEYAERFECTRHTIRNIFNQTPGRIDGRLKRC